MRPLAVMFDGGDVLLAMLLLLANEGDDDVSLFVAAAQVTTPSWITQRPTSRPRQKSFDIVCVLPVAGERERCQSRTGISSPVVRAVSALVRHSVMNSRSSLKIYYTPMGGYLVMHHTGRAVCEKMIGFACMVCRHRGGRGINVITAVRLPG